jgi:hypothetical protein
MEILLVVAFAIVATVAIAAIGMRRTRSDMADFERHTPDPVTGISDADWDFANR